MNGTVEKYNGKSIRIDGAVYRIEVILTSAELSVYLHPIGDGAIACSQTDTDSYPYTHGGKVYQKAVMKAKEIHTEIEASIETDF